MARTLLLALGTAEPALPHERQVARLLQQLRNVLGPWSEQDRVGVIVAGDSLRSHTLAPAAVAPPLSPFGRELALWRVPPALPLEQTAQLIDTLARWLGNSPGEPTCYVLTHAAPHCVVLLVLTAAICGAPLATVDPDAGTLVQRIELPPLVPDPQLWIDWLSEPAGPKGANDAALSSDPLGASLYRKLRFIWPDASEIPCPWGSHGPESHGTVAPEPRTTTPNKPQPVSRPSDTLLGERFRRLLARCYRDRVTGLANRAFYEDVFATHVARRWSHQAAGLILLDINNLKDINDTIGYAAGDRVLSVVGAELTRAVTAWNCGEAYAIRWGGDEFLVGFSDERLTEATVCWRRDQLHVQLSGALRGLPGAPSVTVVAAFTPPGGPSLIACFDRLDQELRAAKRRSKG